MNDCGTPKVVEIKCPGSAVLFHKVIFPAEMGDDETNPPYPGQYRNVLLEYEANGHIWMFSSDGIPTFISNGKDEEGTIDYERLINKPLINGVELVGDVSLDDIGVTNLVASEADAREQADALLQGAIDAEADAREAAISAEESARIIADNDIISRIPVVNDATLTIQKNGSTVATFTANDADNVTADIAVPTKTSDITNDSGFITNTVNNLTNYYTKTESDMALTDEATTRANADLNLQEQIDAISSSSDVVDVVGTYAELQAYDTSKLHDNDIVKVLTDETHDDAISYYRWDDANDTFVYIGSQGPFYTKSETDATFVPQTRTVNNKALSSNITLTAADVGALPDSTVIPTVNNATLTIQKNGTNVQTFTANQATNATANITVPVNTSDLNNDGDGQSPFATEDYVGTYGGKIDTIEVNGTAQPIVDKTVDIAVPTKTSDLTNDSGFITNSVNDLTNYYQKSETYTKTEVDGLIPTRTSDLINDGADRTSTYVEADDLAAVATSGSYNDLSNKPTIPAAQVNSDWNANSGVAQILNKPNLATVATSGSYNDLSNKPTIPAAQVNSDWDASSGVAQILNKPSLATVATSGSYNDLTDKPDISLVEMSYGESNAWAKFIAAYQAGKIVYCRASSNSNPATGTQGRKAFMAYVNNAENPTEVEFQYVRSVSSKTASQPVDQVFVYKLTSANGGTWTVQTRDMGPRLAQGTNTTVSYSNGTYTVNASQPTKTSDLTNDSGFLTNTDYATASTGGVVKVGGGLEITNGVLSATGGGTADAVEWLNVLNRPSDVSYWTNDAGYITSADLPTVGNATLTIQKNGTSAGTFTANATSNKTINITVPTTAADVSALPASTKYGASIAVSINTTDYKVTTTLKDQDGNTLGTAQVIDLPLESVVVNGSYDDTDKKIVLTLQNGNTIDIPVADLVAGLQSEITSTNKLASDLVDDTNQTHKFVTAAQITKLNGIAAGAEVNQNAFSNVKVGTTTVAADAKTDTLELVAGSNVTLTPDATNDKVTIAATNTTYSDATTSAHGLMSAADKTKLNGIAAGAEVNVQADWEQTTTTADDYIKNKPTLAAVATSGSYNDLSNKPTIPTVNNATLTIQKNGTTVKTFTANASSNVTANITVPTKTSDITNDSDFVASGDLATVATSGSYNDLSNKPTIPAAQVNSDWNATSGKAQILNKPTLATVATSGSYNDLSNKPTIPAAQVQSNWTQTTTTAVDYIKNKPTLATVATSGSYNDLSNKPTIPTVNNATLTIQKNGTNVQTFTANQSTNATANITVPTKISDLTNTSGGFVTYCTCATAAATAAKVVTLDSGDSNWVLRKGDIIAVKFTYTNTASSVTLNVNGTGAKSIWYNNAAYTGSSNSITGYANRYLFYLYDGTNWVWFSDGRHDGNDNTYTTAYCSTAAGTAAKVAYMTGYTLTANRYTVITFTNANSAASALTLNINSRGAKPLYINGTASSSSNHTLAAGSYIVYYDGTNYYINNNGEIPRMIHSESPVSTSSVTPIVTNSMISDGTITFAKTATGEFLKLTLTTTDPGAGSALAANTLLGVYE